MKILIIAVGKKHEESIASLVEEFTTRIGRYTDIEWKLIGASDIESECASIAKAVDSRDFVVLLDEKGKEMTSVDLADFFQKRLNESIHRMVFIIGGAYGVNDALKQKANTIISLSKMTFPHQVVRLVLVEQIYRTYTILKGEKYHHS